MDLSELIRKVEEIYKKYMISDNTPDMEADLKIQLLENLASMIAFANLRKGVHSEQLKTKINELKEKLLSWDPFGPWFKETKDLYSNTYDLLTFAKTLKFEEEIMPTNVVTIDDFNVFKNNVQKELQALKEDVISIKKLINKLATQKAAVEVAKPISKPIPAPEEAPEIIVVSKPVPVTPKPSSEKVIPKPVPLDTPIPESTPTAVPKPAPEPKLIPKPVPVTPEPIPEPITPEEMGPDLTDMLAAKKKDEETKDSSKLFGLFSKPTVEEVPTTPKPAPKSVGPSHITKSIPKIVPIKVTPVQPAIKSVAPMKSVEPKPISLKPVSVKPIEIPPPVAPSMIPESSDPEELYHELISLQGKRYGLERGIKELKALNESGSISEEEYKQKLSSKLEELKKISATIERIREKLE